MNGAWSLVCVLVGCGLWTFPEPAVISQARRPPAKRASTFRPESRRALVVATGIVGVGMLFGGVWWLVAGAALVGGLIVRQIPVGPTAAQRAAERTLLAVHADLLVACLESGMPVGAALDAATSQLTAADPEPELPFGGQELNALEGRGGAAGRGRGRGPAGRGFRRSRGGSPASALPRGASGKVPQDSALVALDHVAALLRLGADADSAWQPADRYPDLAVLAAAARRSAAGGVTLAGAVRDHAQSLRMRVASDAERTAGRAGVAMTGPLGLCFLPAFLCLGLAPVVVGLLGTLGVF